MLPWTTLTVSISTNMRPPFSYALSNGEHWRHTTRPLYRNGTPIGTIGVAHPLARHPFPSHLSAMRYGLDPIKDPHPMSLAASGPTPLSAAVIMDLRVSVRSRVSDPAGEGQLSPCVRYNASLDAYELHKGGAILCWTPDLAVVAALLRGERFEPGFIGKCLDPAYLATELALDADAREAERRRRAQMAEDARSRVASDQEALARRNALTHQKDAPDDLSLDDLLDTL